jgi:hypothetical protein
VWTFGFRRAEVLSAQANGITLLVISALVAFEAISRLVRPLPVPGLYRRAVRLEQFSIGWMLIEAGVAITAGTIAGSLALTSFGYDSVIELISATWSCARLRAELSGGRLTSRPRGGSCGSSPSRSSSWPPTCWSAQSSTSPPARIQSDHRPASA